jgi:mRNA interferase RelE/StbE
VSAASPVFEIIYSKSAVADLDKLPVRNAAQIVKKIGRLATGLQGDIKKLQKHDVAYRLRMGNYRILFDVVGDTILIQRVKDRKEAYD